MSFQTIGVIAIENDFPVKTPLAIHNLFSVTLSLIVPLPHDTPSIRCIAKITKLHNLLLQENETSQNLNSQWNTTPSLRFLNYCMHQRLLLALGASGHIL